MNTKEIFISVFQLAEKGKLSKVEQKQIMEALISYGNSINPKELDETFKRIRLGSRTLLEQTETCIDSALRVVKDFNKYIEDAELTIQSMPKGAVFGDDTKTLEFIKSLTEDAYNYSQAEKLIGISRQTIKAHADKGKHGLNTFTISKSEYINRENLINYYRAYFNKDGFSY
ncbi:hypothetical protein [Bizionia sp. M204]|uniref:hypothetical protein n=1 Tax=Bizionia sp. M204 TaxID=2675331 RepID=UPI00205BEB3A|nr:hypothetical protein [Bizionia sp. M204]UPS90289.1 hypothetical protein GMA17_00505 [Bizionia sp. M204]